MHTALVSRFSHKPKSLFILDGLGALTSAILLGIVLVQLESFFGIPIPTLYILAGLPLLFLVFDFWAYFQKHNTDALNLKIIAWINFLYCIVSLTFAFAHIGALTFYGWTYIVIEVAIVLFLAKIELNVAKHLLNTNKPA